MLNVGGGTGGRIGGGGLGGILVRAQAKDKKDRQEATIKKHWWREMIPTPVLFKGWGICKVQKGWGQEKDLPVD